MCLKLIVRTLERRQWHYSGILIVNFQQISFGASIGDFKQVNVGSVNQLQNGIYFGSEH